jgi:hypothetical protein
MDNFPYCTISFCPRRLDCQSELAIQTMILVQTQTLKLIQNHCQSVVLQYLNPDHPDTYMPDLRPPTPLETLNKQKGLICVS